MSAYSYTSFLDLANRMFTKFGHTSVSYTSSVPGDYDPSTRNVAMTEVTTTIDTIILQTITNSDRKGHDEQFAKAGYTVTGLVIGDARFMMFAGDALPSAPKPGDRATFEGKTWMVRGVTTINPGGQVIAYKCGVYV